MLSQLRDAGRWEKAQNKDWYFSKYQRFHIFIIMAQMKNCFSLLTYLKSSCQNCSGILKPILIKINCKSSLLGRNYNTSLIAHTDIPHKSKQEMLLKQSTIFKVFNYWLLFTLSFFFFFFFTVNHRGFSGLSYWDINLSTEGHKVIPWLNYVNLNIGFTVG